MDVMYGETGRTGDPATLPNTGLDRYQVQGNGEFRIGTGGTSIYEKLIWYPVESVRYGIYSQLPVGVPSRDVHLEKVHGAPGEEPNRLNGPIQFVSKLLEFWRLETDDAVGLLGFDSADATYVADVLGGHEPIRGRDVKDRIAHLFHIRATLWSLFRDLETENNWLREPHALLDERSPLSLMVGSMEDLLLAREYVESAAGR